MEQVCKQNANSKARVADEIQLAGGADRHAERAKEGHDDEEDGEEEAEDFADA